MMRICTSLDGGKSRSFNSNGMSPSSVTPCGLIISSIGLANLSKFGWSRNLLPTLSKINKFKSCDCNFSIDFIGRTTLNARQVAFRTVLRRKFGAMFKPEFSSEGLQLPGEMEKVGPLDVVQLSSRDGWFVLAWKISKKGHGHH